MSANTPSDSGREDKIIDWGAVREETRNALKSGAQHAGAEIRAGNPTYKKFGMGVLVTYIGYIIRPLNAVAAAAGSGIRIIRDRRHPESQPGRAYEITMFTLAAIGTVAGFFAGHPEAGGMFLLGDKSTGATGTRPRRERSPKA